MMMNQVLTKYADDKQLAKSQSTLKQEEKEEEWEKQHQYKEQHKDRTLQFQIHQDNMQHQQQFITICLQCC